MSKEWLMGGNAAGSFYFVRRLKAAMSCVAATAITASTLLLGLVAVSSVTAPPAAAAASSWTAFVYNLGGFVQPILNVQSGNPTLGTSFNSPAAGGGGDSASGTSVSPDGTYLFASNYGQNSVSVFLTSTDAQVTTLTTKVSGPFDNAVSPDGTELWVANYGSSSLTVFCIASGGCNGGVYTQWQEITNITGSGLNGPIDVAISPNDEYAYAANYNSYTDSVFCANWSGCYGTAAFGAMSFSPMALYGTAGSYGIDWTAFTPDGQYAYVADCGNTACSAQGDLSMIQNAEGSNPTFVSRNTTNGYGTNQVDIAPNCTTSSCTAYVTNFGHLSTGNIQVYTGADSGSFPSLQTTYGNAQNSSVYNPNYFAITPDSNYLIVSDSGVYGSGNSDQVDVFATSSDTVTHILGGSSNYPWTVATQPDQAPTAVLSAYPAGYGQSSFFDGSGSTNPIANPAGGSAIKSYAWNFGNGCTATTTGSQVNFVYSSTNASLCASPTVVGSGAVSTYGGTVAVSGSNTYTVTLTVTNWANTSTSIIYTGHTVSNNGSSLALASKTITLPTKLAVTSSPTSGVTMSSNPNIGPITIQMQTSTGTGINAPPAASGITDTINLAASPSLGAVFSAWNGTSCGSTTITSINVTAGQSSVQVCFGDATAASYTLTFSGSGGASGLTSVTQNITVAANGAYQLDFTTAAMSHICINSGACPSGPTGLGGELGPMTVEVDNAGGTAVNPGSNVNINLSSAGGSGTAAFYTVSGGVCTTTVTTSVSVLTSATSASFCYSYSAPDVQPTITATATSGFPATHGNLAPTQIETIAGPATQIVFTTAAESALYISTTTPNMGPIVVSLEDSSGYVTNATSSVTVNLSSSLSGGTKKPYFCQWSGASCSGASSTPTAAYAIATGGSTLTFGFGYNKGNTYPILTAAATGLTSGTQTETIASGAPA
ncbi:MAG TPA: beta-propeller fold lactonase family protein, partial [Acidimicrobiales bacterium]|nr:beta-propeller fold lactonase family protein [Acidimicrobiales bacterium]